MIDQTFKNDSLSNKTVGLKKYMNKITLKNLKLYKKYKDKDMTMLSLFIDNALIYLISAIVFLAAYFLYLHIMPSIANYFLIGFVFIILRDTGFYLRSVYLWPTLRGLIDWNKLELILSENDKNNFN